MSKHSTSARKDGLVDLAPQQSEEERANAPAAPGPAPAALAASAAPSAPAASAVSTPKKRDAPALKKEDLTAVRERLHALKMARLQKDFDRANDEANALRAAASSQAPAAASLGGMKIKPCDEDDLEGESSRTRRLGSAI